MPQTDPKNINNFSRLEKEALKEILLDIIRSDLERSLKKMHQKSMVDVESRLVYSPPIVMLNLVLGEARWCLGKRGLFQHLKEIPK